MIFEKEYLPQFREADGSGRIGLRGYMNYFQDMATHYMYNLGKGNDTLPEEYHICWMYTKYRMHLEKEADFTAPLQLATWVEKEKSSIRIRQDLTISRDGELYAWGRVESCLFHMDEKRISRLCEINYPENTPEERTVELPSFTKFGKETGDMEYSYTYTVRYTDLDKSGHMNNLLYINLFLNAFDSGFYVENRIRDFEIHYLAQCYEKEEIRVCLKKGSGKILLAGIKADGSVAVQGLLEVEAVS